MAGSDRIARGNPHRPLTQPPIKHPRHRRTLCLLLAAAAGSIYATLTPRVTASPQTITWAGAIDLSTGPTNDAATGAASIAPGDAISREVDLSDTQGSTANKEITLKFAASPTSLLDSDPTNGLQVNIQQCSQAWQRSAPDSPSPAFRYTCRPGAKTIKINGAASASVQTLESHAGALTSGNPLNDGGNDFLVLTLTLPAAAPGDLARVAACSGTPGGTAATQDLQGCSSTLSYTFRVTQRPRIDRPKPDTAMFA